jgi:chromosomal replication initiation ATPase DnaA
MNTVEIRPWRVTRRRDVHTTVLHSINKIEAQRQHDKDLNRTINRLMDSFG